MDKFGGFIFHVFLASGKACDECVSLTGYYDDEPERPHANCDCDIFMVADVGNYEVIYKNEERVKGADYEEVRSGGVGREFVNTSNRKTKHTFEISESFEASLEVTAEIEKVFKVSSSFKAEVSVSDSVEVELEPGDAVCVNVIGILHTEHLSADRYILFESALGSESAFSEPLMYLM